MNVVTHTAKAMDAMPIALDAFLQQQIEMIAIGIGEEDRLSAIAAQHHMVETAGHMKPGLAGHTDNGKAAKLIIQLFRPDPNGEWHLLKFLWMSICPYIISGYLSWLGKQRKRFRPSLNSSWLNAVRAITNLLLRY